jgi:CubicO group peptidase (beta-lactamase class C family)
VKPSGCAALVFAIVMAAGSAFIPRAAHGETTTPPGSAETTALFDPTREQALGQTDDAAAMVPDDDAANDSDTERLRARIAEIVERSGVPGAAVAVVTRTGTWTQAFGQIARGGRPMDVDTLFRGGSLTKPFMALAVLRLAEKGRLRLDDKVRDLVPEIAVGNPWERTYPLRLEHLLSHTAGFDEMRFNEIFAPADGQDWPLARVLAVNPRSRVARWRPGTRFSYSQPGYTLVGAILEKVAGLPLDQVLQDEVFAPLGISGATLRLDAAARARLAIGHHRGRPAEEIRLLHRPAGNLMISANAMARLLEVQLRRGVGGDGRRFLAAASIDRMERCGPLQHVPPAVCYALGNWGDVGGPVPMRGHGGYLPGYQGFYRYSPELGFGYAILTNSSSAGGTLGAISGTIMRHLLRDQRPPRPTLPPPPAGGFSRYAGHYRLVSPEIEFLRFKTDVYDAIDVSVVDGQVQLNRKGRGAVPIVWAGAERFRFPRDNASSIEFSRGPEGRPTMVLRGGTYEQESAGWATARRWLLEIALVLLALSIVVPPAMLLAGDREAAKLGAWQAAAALALWAMPYAFNLARAEGTLGLRNLTTTAVWLCSWTFAAASYASFYRAVHALGSSRIPRIVQGHALVSALAAVWITLHLSRYGLIGLKTWCW